MSGTTSHARPWVEQVASVISETAGEVVPYEDCLKAAERIQKLNQPIDPNASLLGSAPGNDLLVLMVAELKRRLQTPSVVQTMSAGEMEMIRKLLADNTVTLASIRRGDFGETVKGIEEAYPFPEGPRALQ
jgi:hypothetical protein